ncbi:MAG: 50S ribosomal protein L29 [Nitrospinaceae bacterium]|nr:50S ribosomal protein L29 [Nitrospinaceae bacterium]NIR55550.1 50S ribosomal protein L29 [Nitrospinaceae bacterium]NIS85984.1 50S ribosomal protein L29 [Nitrospinaceae bacterium]NIT82830.1 50S ribosomal protein L29 [Nitrospinaceae bacterium]NIU45032.1 50S ribosomal protein L29 [Nitrospinaceae bacterium]
MKMQEILDLSEKERGEKLSDLREEYFNLKFQLATGKIENPGRLKHMRRDIAKILTLRKQTAAPAEKAQSGEAEKK